MSWYSKTTVSDLEDIGNALVDIFPQSIRGSVGHSRWDNGRKVLHLDYWIASDTVGGKKIKAQGDLFFFIEWDSNCGDERKFAESDKEVFIRRVREIYKGKRLEMDSTVCEPIPAFRQPTPPSAPEKKGGV